MTRRALAIVAVVWLLVAGGMFYGAVRVGQSIEAEQVHTRDVALAHSDRALRQAVSATELGRAIQRERRQEILQSCQQLNERHAGTVRALTAILAQAERRAKPRRRAKIRESERPTLLLIDALAPHRDCEKVAATATRAR